MSDDIHWSNWWRCGTGTSKVEPPRPVPKAPPPERKPPPKTSQEWLYSTYSMMCNNQEDGMPIYVEFAEIPVAPIMESGDSVDIKWNDGRAVRPGDYLQPVYLRSAVYASRLWVGLTTAEKAVRAAKEETKNALYGALARELARELAQAEVSDELLGFIDRIKKAVDTIPV